MAKTKQIGVRFDQDMLDMMQEDGIADSPQKALNFLTDFYRQHREKVDVKKLITESKLLEKEEGFEKNPPPVLENNITIDDLNKLTNKVEPQKPAGSEKSNFTINTIPPMPKKEDFKHSVDYGAAKSEWKLKYNQMCKKKFNHE